MLAYDESKHPRPHFQEQFQMEEKIKSIAEVASEGGRARAESLSPEEREEIARKAAIARWNAGIPKATHAGVLHIGDIEIPCAVLDDGTRVLTQRGFSVALGRYKNPNRKGAIADLPVFLTANNLKEFLDEDLKRSATEIKFRLAEGSGGLEGNIALGYRATLLQEVCNVYLKAKHAGKLLKSQEHIAQRCLILLNGLATVGIIALVDEATGYQYDRARHALEEILEKFIATELVKWTKMFPDIFYQEMFRLKNWRFNAIPSRRPILVGKLTTNIVYERLAPGVLEELKRITPRDDKGRLKHKLFQRLTEDVGHPRLREHLSAVIALMKANDDWQGFYRALNRALPPQVQLPLFEHVEAATVEVETNDQEATSSSAPELPS
jgi:P63C domain